MEKTNRPQNFMDRHDNDDELFLEELGRLWRSQPVPPIPDPPRERMIPLRLVAGIAALLLLIGGGIALLIPSGQEPGQLAEATPQKIIGEQVPPALPSSQPAKTVVTSAVRPIDDEEILLVCCNNLCDTAMVTSEISFTLSNLLS